MREVCLESWLPIGLLAVIVNSLILALTFIFLFSSHKQRYLLAWGCAFAAFSARSLCILANVSFGGQVRVLRIGEQYFILAAVASLYYGASTFSGKTFPKWMRWSLAAVAIWVPIAVTLQTGWALLYIPSYVLLGSMFITCGLLIKRQPARFGNAGRRIAGVSLVIWGLHQYDYFLLRHVGWFAPWGFLFGATLALTTAIGIIIMFFETIQVEQQEQENRFHSVLRSAMDGFWILDAKGRVMEVNKAYCRMSGYTREELLNMCVVDLDATMTPEAIEDSMRAITAIGEARFETRHRRRDGGVFDVEVSVQYHPGEDRLFVSFLRDISEWSCPR